MFEKQSRSELKAFGLLLGFMAICGSLGTIFFSKIVLLLSNVSFLGNLFLFFVSFTVIGGTGYGLYRWIKKAIPMISNLGGIISLYTKKAWATLKNKKELYMEDSRTNGFIASFKINKKSDK